MSEDRQYERLWTPWRMRYIGGQAKEEGCIFCNRLHGSDDVESLILYRGTYCFVIMNLFPYNTGHVMIVPNLHADDPSQLDADTLHEMADLLPVVTRALKRNLNCQGFNVGLNIGSVAGAGIAEHLHEHVVPRWLGDANFMPILASTMVIPEVIPSTYAKVRAELQREFSGNTDVRLIVLLDDDRELLLVDGRLPVATAAPDQSVARAALAGVSAWATDLEVAGWAGVNRADDSTIAGKGAGLVLRGTGNERSNLPPHAAFAPLNDGTLGKLTESDRAFVQRGLRQLAPSVMSPSALDETGT